MAAANPKDIASMPFEEALKELETIVRGLESGDTALDKAIEDYTRGTQLKAHCQKKLDEARLKVEKISVAATGEVSLEPFEK